MVDNNHIASYIKLSEYLNAGLLYSLRALLSLIRRGFQENCSGVLFRHPSIRRIVKRLNTTQIILRGTRYMVRIMDKAVTLKSLNQPSVPSSNPPMRNRKSIWRAKFGLDGNLSANRIYRHVYIYIYMYMYHRDVLCMYMCVFDRSQELRELSMRTSTTCVGTVLGNDARHDELRKTLNDGQRQYMLVLRI